MYNKKRWNTEDTKGLLMLLIALILVSVIGYLYITLSHKNAYNEKTLCPYNIPYQQTVLLIDKSDIWDTTQIHKIENLIQKYAQQTEKLQRFTVKVIEANEQNKTTLHTYFDACNPGKEANPLYQNPRRILKQYQKHFQAPLQNLLKTLSSPRIANTSPILDTLHKTLKTSEATKIKLVLLSDLWEYSSIFNFYQEIPSIKVVKKAYPFAKERLKMLELIQIHREKRKSRTPKLIAFYKALSQDLGADFSHQSFKRE